MSGKTNPNRKYLLPLTAPADIKLHASASGSFDLETQGTPLYWPTESTTVQFVHQPFPWYGDLEVSATGAIRHPRFKEPLLIEVQREDGQTYVGDLNYSTRFDVMAYARPTVSGLVSVSLRDLRAEGWGARGYGVDAGYGVGARPLSEVAPTHPQWWELLRAEWLHALRYLEGYAKRRSRNREARHQRAVRSGKSPTAWRQATTAELRARESLERIAELLVHGGLPELRAIHTTLELARSNARTLARDEADDVQVGLDAAREGLLEEGPMQARRRDLHETLVAHIEAQLDLARHAGYGRCWQSVDEVRVAAAELAMRRP
jgi:hypothetical protein